MRGRSVSSSGDPWASMDFTSESADVLSAAATAAAAASQAAAEAAARARARAEFLAMGFLDRARVVEKRLRAAGRSLGHEIAHALTTPVYGPAHALLAPLPVKEVVTTNYDTLLEDAFSSTGIPVRARWRVCACGEGGGGGCRTTAGLAR